MAVGITYLGVTSSAGYVWLACLGALGLTLVVSVLGGAGVTGATGGGSF